MDIRVCCNDSLFKVRRKIAKALVYWSAQLEEVGDVQYEIYKATLRYGPTPYISLAYQDEEAPRSLVGICCSFVNTYRNEMYLKNLIVRDDCDNPTLCQLRLVESVIDRSQSYGFHGWVSVLPKEDERELSKWRQLGFSIHDDHELCYRRMGYFVR